MSGRLRQISTGSAVSLGDEQSPASQWWRSWRSAALLGILWPRRDWEYVMRPELLVENYIEHPQPLHMSQIHRDLALYMDRSYLQNRGQLLRLTWLFRLASVLLVVEVVAWVVDLLVQS
jgi:hypothetical protein